MEITSTDGSKQKLTSIDQISCVAKTANSNFCPSHPTFRESPVTVLNDPPPPPPTTEHEFTAFIEPQVIFDLIYQQNLRYRATIL